MSLGGRPVERDPANRRILKPVKLMGALERRVNYQRAIYGTDTPAEITASRQEGRPTRSLPLTPAQRRRHSHKLDRAISVKAGHRLRGPAQTLSKAALADAR